MPGAERVAKTDPIIEACGAIDELNAVLGVARAVGIDADLADMLAAIQRDLFAIGGRLADPARTAVERLPKLALSSHDVARLEEWIDRLEAELPPLRRFILPGGSAAGSALHLARSVCRRVERRIVALGRDRTEPEVLAYMNRLSDLLFVMARTANRRTGEPEAEW